MGGVSHYRNWRVTEYQSSEGPERWSVPEAFKPSPAERRTLQSCREGWPWSVSQPSFLFQPKHCYFYALCVGFLHKVLLLLQEMCEALLYSDSPRVRQRKKGSPRVSRTLPEHTASLGQTRDFSLAPFPSVQKETNGMSSFQEEFVSPQGISRVPASGLVGTQLAVSPLDAITDKQP